MTAKQTLAPYRLQYVVGSLLTQRDVAEASGIPLSTVTKVAQEEGWSAQRKEYKEAAGEAAGMHTERMCSQAALRVSRATDHLALRLEQLAVNAATSTTEPYNAREVQALMDLVFSGVEKLRKLTGAGDIGAAPHEAIGAALDIRITPSAASASAALIEELSRAGRDAYSAQKQNEMDQADKDTQ